MPRSAKRAALVAMWSAVLLSSTMLINVHWAAAVGTLCAGGVGTLAILCWVRTVPDNRWRAAELAVKFDRIRPARA
jgi:hypothetical protein